MSDIENECRAKLLEAGWVEVRGYPHHYTKPFTEKQKRLLGTRPTSLINEVLRKSQMTPTPKPFEARE